MTPAKKTEPNEMTPAQEIMFARFKLEVESMSDAKLHFMLFHTIHESARRHSRDRVIRQLRGQVRHLERWRAQAAH